MRLFVANREKTLSPPLPGWKISIRKIFYDFSKNVMPHSKHIFIILNTMKAYISIHA